jgi:hypothetical protein
MFLRAAVLFLTYITFSLLTSAIIALFIRAVAVIKAVVLIIFVVYIKGFKQLLRLISIA